MIFERKNRAKKADRQIKVQRQTEIQAYKDEQIDRYRWRLRDKEGDKWIKQDICRNIKPYKGYYDCTRLSLVLIEYDSLTLKISYPFVFTFVLFWN